MTGEIKAIAAVKPEFALIVNDHNWTAEELAIMKQGGSVPVVVNGTVFQARMPRNAKR